MNHITRRIHLTEHESLSQHDFAIERAVFYSKKYHNAGLSYSSSMIHRFIRAIDNDDEWPSKLEEDDEICADLTKILERSRQIEQAKEVKEVSVEIVSGEVDAVESAMATTLTNGAFTNHVNKVYEFTEDMTSVKVRDGVTETGNDAAALLGLGADMGRKGIWLAMEGAHRLMERGMEDALIQICAKLRLKESTIYNYLRSYPFATQEVRKALPPTVLVEICTAKYCDDKDQNEQKKRDLIEWAIKEQADVKETRSHVRAEKNDQTPVEGRKTLRERVNELERALRAMLDRYSVLADGGDDNFWNWREEEPVKQAYAALGEPVPSIVNEPQREAD